MISIYVEHRISDIAIGYRNYPESDQWEKVEQVVENRQVTVIDVSEVPEYVKGAVKILLEEEV